MWPFKKKPPVAPPERTKENTPLGTILRGSLGQGNGHCGLCETGIDTATENVYWIYDGNNWFGEKVHLDPVFCSRPCAVHYCKLQDEGVL